MKKNGGFVEVHYFVGVPNNARLNLAVRLRAFLLRFSPQEDLA
jgi:hypothetical protein